MTSQLQQTTLKGDFLVRGIVTGLATKYHKKVLAAARLLVLLKCVSLPLLCLSLATILSVDFLPSHRLTHSHIDTHIHTYTHIHMLSPFLGGLLLGSRESHCSLSHATHSCGSWQARLRGTKMGCEGKVWEKRGSLVDNNAFPFSMSAR